MSQFIKHRFSRREKALALVLIVALLVGLYFFAVHFPVTRGISQAEQDTEEVDARLTEAQAKMAEYTQMQQELEEILAQPADQITIMPPYNNIETLMQRLDVIFAGTNAQFSFGQAQITEGVAARSISFQCTAASYQEARRLLRDLTGMGYRCLINSFSFNPESDTSLYSGPLDVSASVTFYEYAGEPEEESVEAAEE